MSLEQEKYSLKVINNEKKYLNGITSEDQSTVKAVNDKNNPDVAEPNSIQVILTSSPLKIPKNVIGKSETKTGYKQITYHWKRRKYSYEARWHTKTRHAPSDQGNTWVIVRILPGQGFGKNAHRRQEWIYIKSGKSGRWITKKIWQDAIHARKTGTITKAQERILKNGHWKAK